VHGEHQFSENVHVKDPALNAVLFDFNPSSSHDVTTIKALCAGVIQKMHDIQANPEATPARKRMAAVAITQMEIVQMCAVKALFAK
jgi:hypothetical protein